MSLTDNPRFVSRLTRGTLALILAGGRGSRLQHLTKWRSKPSLPFGGKFRIIDFPLSNCVNSGIRRIGVLTQYKAHSLILHIQRGWGFLRGEFGEYVELLPAQQRVESHWYTGTADAVYQNIDIIRDHDPEFILVLAGDHIYKMDYGAMIAHHVASQADMTVGCIEVPRDQAQGLGIMSVDANDRITEFVEKPASPAGIPGREHMSLASMGIYVFNCGFLFEQLVRDADTAESTHDFGQDIIPYVISRYRVMAHSFTDPSTNERAYWRDVGTVDAYWEANLELTKIVPPLNLYDEDWPIWTYQVQLPPAKFVFDEQDRRGMAVDSMVSGGCIVSGGVARNSLLFSNVLINARSELNRTVVLPDTQIGERCQISNAVIDEGCRVPDGTVIGVDPELDGSRFHVTSKGIVVVTPEMLGQVTHRVV